MEKENKNLKTIYLQKDSEGKRFGSGNWADEQQIYVKNFRPKCDMYIADVDYKSEETYTNNSGMVCHRHKICGVLSLTKESATIVISLNGVTEKLTCEPKFIISKKNNKPYIMLDFSSSV